MKTDSLTQGTSLAFPADISTSSSIRIIAALLCVCQWNSVTAQEPARWYQVEVSIFTNENSNLMAERWPIDRIESGFPGNVRPLDSLINYLDLDDWAKLNPPLPRNTSVSPGLDESDVLPQREGPDPLHNSDYRLPDFERDAFVALPASAHNFTDTNRALNASASYRLLYHNAWRQPVTQSARAVPIAILAGQKFGERHELEGSLTIRFNPSQDRVVLDSLMWLTQFGALPPNNAQQLLLPALPESLRQNTATNYDDQIYYPRQIIPVRHSRDMRSNEFHYVDHPALGIVIQVFPFTPPPAPPLNTIEDQTPL